MPRKPHGSSILKLQVILAILFALLLGGGGWWYLTHSRRPKSAQAAPQPVLLPSKPGPAPQPKVTATPAPPVAVHSAPPVPPLVVPPAPTAAAPLAPEPARPEPITLRKLPELSTGERPDLLLVKRTERRFSKLQEWAARLNAKKATLKTPLQIEAFNEEAVKYHAELADARAEAAARPAAVP